MTLTPDQRKKKIVEVLKQREYADFSYLGQLFSVSEMTIRRDIEFLEKRGIVMRVYGGAKIRSERGYEASIQKRLNTNLQEKRAIAMEAAKQIQDGDVIALDGSTTALQVSKWIKDRKKLTVITNNISISMELATAPQIQTVLLGGFLRQSSLTLVGEMIKQSLNSFYIDKAFISSKAIHHTKGLTDFTVEEGQAKQAMIEKSNQVYVLVDRTKFGKASFFQVMSPNEIETIITDQLKPLTYEQKECVQAFRDHGATVIKSLGEQEKNGG